MAGKIARKEMQAQGSGPEACHGKEDRVTKARMGGGQKAKSREAAIRYIDSMAKQVFAQSIKEVQRSGAVERLESIVLAWPERSEG